jgi:hypothetical protein
MTGLSLIMTYAVNLTRFSVITAIMLHAAFNTASRLLVGLFEKTQPDTSLPFELVLAFYGVGVGLTLVLVTRGRLAYVSSRNPVAIEPSLPE